MENKDFRVICAALKIPATKTFKKSVWGWGDSSAGKVLTIQARDLSSDSHEP